MIVVYQTGLLLTLERSRCPRRVPVENQAGTDVLIRRAEHIASLVEQIGDTGWVADLISMLRRSDETAGAEFVMVEMTLADVERSARKLLDLRDNLVNELGSLGARHEPPRTASTPRRRGKQS